MNIVFLDLRKAVNTVSHKILTYKLLMYRLAEQTVRWTGHCKRVGAQRVVISSTKSR